MLAGALALAGNASAEGPAIALTYKAPAICPSAGEFHREIQHFLPGLSVVSPASATRVFDVSIDESGVLGELRVLGAQDGGSRQAQGADCAEVARLLAFAVALVLDPNLQIAEPPPADAGGPAPEPGPEPAPPHQALPSPASLGVASRKEQSPPLTARRRRPALRHSLGAIGFAASATSPTPTYGVGAVYALAGRLGSVEPELRLGASYSTSADAARAAATVSFANVLGLLEGCPATLHAATVDFLPCVRIDAGARSTNGQGIPNAKQQVRPWLSFDALVHVRWHLAPPVSLELGGGAMVPAWHDHVFFEPNTTVHQVPNLGWVGEIAVHVEFADQNRN